MRLSICAAITVGAGVVASALGASAAGSAATSEKPTYTRDVAPILFENCVICHRPDQGAPMSLRTYDEARPWAKAMKDMVTSKKMPPWFADPNHGKFKNDTSLSAAEIETIAKWVDGGAVRGDMKDMPAMPNLPEGWRMGEPDYIVDLPEVNVPAEGGDYFPDLNFTADMPEDHWIQAVEFRPSNHEVTHHVVIFMNGGVGMNGQFDVLGVWAVGMPPNVYPEGMGRKLQKGQRLMANMHYHPNGKPQVDKTQIGLYFGKGEMQHEVRAALAGSFSIEVPKLDPNHHESASWYADRDIKIISLFPHMHLRGKDMKLTAVYPDKREDILLSVPGYDFNWQLFYYPEQPISLPAGTRIDIDAHYDNSANNPNNPDPNRDVSFGTATTDEMLFGIFEYIYDGEAKANTPEDKLGQFAAGFPDGEAFLVSIPMGEARIQTVMHLPKAGGEGKWLLMAGGQQFTQPIQNVVWSENLCRADVSFKLGRFNGDLAMEGTLAPDGTFSGTFKNKGDSPFPIPNFTGSIYSK